MSYHVRVRKLSDWGRSDGWPSWSTRAPLLVGDDQVADGDVGFRHRLGAVLPLKRGAEFEVRLQRRVGEHIGAARRAAGHVEGDGEERRPRRPGLIAVADRR